MNGIFQKTRLIQLALILLILANTHGAMAYEVEMNNETPNDYVVRYTTWDMDTRRIENKYPLRCKANKECKTLPDTDPMDTGSMGVKLTGQFEIFESKNPGIIVSKKEKVSEMRRTYSCFIRAYMRNGQPAFSYHDHD